MFCVLPNKAPLCVYLATQLRLPSEASFTFYLAGLACVYLAHGAFASQSVASLRPSPRNEHSEPSKFLSRALRNFTKLTPTYQSSCTGTTTKAPVQNHT